ncbi:MAG: hypothetical protein V4520_20435 [Bacteroidota bacterium]
MFRTLAFTNLLIFSVLFCNAQKLPGVQKASVFATEKVNIDGRVTEWGEQLQAHNNATNISYTISNDNNNLYLLTQVTDQDAINKILRVGLTFEIRKNDKKNNNGAVSVTYPVVDTPIYVSCILITEGDSTLLRKLLKP